MSVKSWTFRSGRALGTAVAFLLGLDILVAAVIVVLRVLELDLLDRIRQGVFVSAEEATRSDQRMETVSTVWLIGLAITGIVWLVWQHRSQANLHASRLRELDYTPGWAVGWWLVPIANLFKPFQSVRELWKASGGEEEWKRTRTWAVIGWWWGAWLAVAVLSRIATFSFDRAESVDALLVASRLLLATAVVLIVAAILAILIVRAVIERQDRLREIRPGAATPPPRPDVPTEPR